MQRLTVLTLTVALLYAAQSEAQPLQATLNMNEVQACFKFTPLGPNIPGALVEITGVIKAQAVKPNEGFEYHIHEKPVGPNNDCMATSGHLDPLKFGNGRCNPATPDKCQEGDLSGKHGNLKPSAVPVGAITYVDKYLRWEGAATTIVGRSVVVHNNGTRIACGDLLPVGSNSHGVTLAPVAPETYDDDDVERQMGESGEFATAAAQTARHNGAMSGLDERVAAWTLATTVAAGVVAALMAL
ncbi:hypothetical protein BG006_004943 [Podila minutissima]|uniref:Superoxide dismutase copper/zinc binding domain-containing protein n=1 Tax=Podila minutissima TaxID=64525 RepID=A0A9P5SLG3_9FUNG|nr:hypothetical protein BG006_004943 [Podila minutissima]